MTEPKKPVWRKRHLFPRGLGEVVNLATKPMMDTQGKLYGALIRDWAVIVGDERARITTPQKLQFPTSETSGAVLHLGVHPAHTPELQYAAAQIIEQCARYFGYKAIERIVLHADYQQMPSTPNAPAKMPTEPAISAEEARAMFAAMRANLHSTDDK